MLKFNLLTITSTTFARLNIAEMTYILRSFQHWLVRRTSTVSPIFLKEIMHAEFIYSNQRVEAPRASTRRLGDTRDRLVKSAGGQSSDNSNS